MNRCLTINHYKPEHKYLRKKIKKWVKREWAELSWYSPDENVYKMNLPFFITKGNKLKVDYDKVPPIKLIIVERSPFIK